MRAGLRKNCTEGGANAKTLKIKSEKKKKNNLKKKLEAAPRRASPRIFAIVFFFFRCDFQCACLIRGFLIPRGALGRPHGEI